MDRILIQNFGTHLKEDISIDSIQVFTGPLSSTVVRLIAVCQELILGNPIEYAGFLHLLADFDLKYEIGETTIIRYERDNFSLEITQGQVKTNYSSPFDQAVLQPVFMPAERSSFPAISNKIFTLLSQKAPLSKRIMDFGARFESSRQAIKKFPVSFLHVTYEFSGGEDYILTDTQQEIRLSESSVAIQMVVPMLLILEYYLNHETQKEISHVFLIEEPELNLSEDLQKGLVGYLVGKIKGTGNWLVVGTRNKVIERELESIRV